MGRDDSIRKCYLDIMKEFIYSRTAGKELCAQEKITRERSRKLFKGRIPKYLVRGDEFYRDADKIFDDNVHDRGRSVGEIYELQKSLKYANCEGQAVFLCYKLHQQGYINARIVAVHNPAHRFVLVDGKHSWLMVDPWCGIFMPICKRAELRSIKDLDRFDYNSKLADRYKDVLLEVAIKILGNFWFYKTPSQIRDDERMHHTTPMEYYGSLISVDKFDGLWEIKNHIGTRSDALREYNGVGLMSFLLKSEIDYALDDYIVNNEQRLINNRRTVGISAREKIDAAYKLKNIIKGDMQVLSSGDIRALTQGRLGKSLDKVFKKMGYLKMLQLISYDSSKDTLI